MSNTPKNLRGFDEFARRWLFTGTRKDELAGYMVDVVLRGSLRRVPPKLRKTALALRILRSGERVKRIRTRRKKARGRIRSGNAR